MRSARCNTASTPWGPRSRVETRSDTRRCRERFPARLELCFVADCSTLIPLSEFSFVTAGAVPISAVELHSSAQPRAAFPAYELLAHAQVTSVPHGSLVK